MTLGKLFCFNAVKAAVSAAFAVLLLVQTALVTFPHVTPGGVRLVICGAGGLETITLLADGSPADRQPGPGAGGSCPFCVVGIAISPEPFATPGRAISFQRFQPDFVAHEPVLPWRLCRLRAIRGPPLTA